MAPRRESLGDTRRRRWRTICKRRPVVPEFAAAFYNAARLYADQGDIARCAEQLSEAVRLQPGLYAEAESDETLGWVLDLSRLREERAGGLASTPETALINRQHETNLLSLLTTTAIAHPTVP